MDISQLEPLFTEDTEPKDEKFIKLVIKAYRGDITCRTAVVDMNIIQPYSSFKPDFDANYRNWFTEQYKKGTPPALFVYEEAGMLIMSDHYNAYFQYLEHSLTQAVCVVVGNTPQLNGVVYDGQPFQLPSPEIYNIDEESL